MFQSSKLLLLAIAGFAFVTCSDPQVISPEDSSSSVSGGTDDSSSSGNDGLSSSPGTSSPGTVSSSSSLLSSSSSIDLGLNCAYKPSWCNGIAYSDVIRESQTGDVGDGPKCIFATAIAQMGNQSKSALLVNGTKLTGQYGGDVWGRCGSAYGWGQLPCSEALTQVQKVDGGYYIYVEEWAGEFNTTGGTPVCTGQGIVVTSSSSAGTTQSSSSISSSSSSSVSNSGKCITPGYFVPPDGVKTCIVVKGECYECNQDRGNDCLNEWLWQGNNISEEYWMKKIPCTSGVDPSTLTCTGLTETAMAGAQIVPPTVQCDGTNVSAGNITWTGAPSWTNPTANTYIVSAKANCGGSQLTAQCGSVQVITPPSNSTLTCTNLARTGVAGTTIAKPTVRCDGAAPSGDITWAPPTLNWTTPAANTYAVTATAECSGSKTAQCGSITVEAAPVFTLTCINLPTTGTVGTAITKPTVRCNGTAVTTAITWDNAPNWDNPTAVQTYNNVIAKATCGSSQQTATCTGGPLVVKAAPTLSCGALPQDKGTVGTSVPSPTVKCGESDVSFGSISWSSTPAGLNWASPAANTYRDIKATANCSGKQQTANCSGSLTISAAATLTCASATQTVTLPTKPKAPEVKCGNTVVSANITWKNNTTTFDWNNATAGNYSNINAAATCNNTSQTANCAGTVIVNATPSSSSVSGGNSSNSGTYPPLTSGKPGWTSRYWDACKQSCSWGGKQQYTPLTNSDRCKACSSNGTSEIAATDNNKSSCDGGGNSYTCYDFIPYVVNDNLAYAFAASPTDQCGKCFQIDFDGGFKHGTANATHQAIKGKTLIVMTSNMGGDVSDGQFDVLIPGGGVGQFDAFSSQIGVSKDKLGKQYGGLLSACEEEKNYNSSQYKDCLLEKCKLFTNADLKKGCEFLANWMQAANNPTMKYAEVKCPDYLLNKYKATMK